MTSRNWRMDRVRRTPAEEAETGLTGNGVYYLAGVPADGTEIWMRPDKTDCRIRTLAELAERLPGAEWCEEELREILSEACLNCGFTKRAFLWYSNAHAAIPEVQLDCLICCRRETLRLSHGKEESSYP